MQCCCTTICPPEAEGSSVCRKCGQDTLGTGPVGSGSDQYEIVRDGSKFGIAVRGEIKIHGLECARAQELAEILNSVQEIDKAP